MKRTFSLFGLLVIGLLLLFNPNTGLVVAATDDVALSAPPPTTIAIEDPPPTTTTAPGDGEPFTVLGDSVETKFGPFQVEIVVEGDRMVDIVTVAEPGDGMSRRINDYVIPLYAEDAISNQSAEIDAISGATITWAAYSESIDSALTKAGI